LTVEIMLQQSGGFGIDKGQFCETAPGIAVDPWFERIWLTN